MRGQDQIRRGPPRPRRRHAVTGVDTQAVGAAQKWREHWAYQPVKKPALPPISDPQSPISNPIDAFVARKLSAAGIAFAPAGEWLAAGCADGSVFRIAASRDDAPRPICHETGSVLALAFQPGKSVLAVAVHGEPIHFRDSESGKELFTVQMQSHPWALAFTTAS